MNLFKKKIPFDFKKTTFPPFLFFPTRKFYDNLKFFHSPVFFPSPLYFPVYPYIWTEPKVVRILKKKKKRMQRNCPTAKILYGKVFYDVSSRGEFSYCKNV